MSFLYIIVFYDVYFAAVVSNINETYLSVVVIFWKNVVADTNSFVDEVYGVCA